MDIIVYKYEHTLECRVDGKVIFVSPVQLGFGSGPKLLEGDGRTPEGEYLVSSKNPNSRFYRALGISYPNPVDALRGLKEGIIDKAAYAEICRTPERPPWNTPLGGFIMIHGQRKTGLNTGDWTAGCIALPNEAMLELFELARIGDNVRILP